MNQTKTIKTGNNTTSRFVAYGDDSRFKDSLAYAFVVIPRTRINFLEKLVRNIKNNFGIPDNIAIHCRVLFNEHQRRKHKIEHLTSDDVRAVVGHCFTAINRASALIRYSACSLEQMQTSLGSDITLRSSTGEEPITKPLSIDDKSVLGLLMQSCFATHPASKSQPHPSDCEIIVSEDSTKTKFVGDSRSRADGLYSGYTDIGAPSNTVYQLAPTILGTTDSLLLQLADVAAYTLSHAESPFSHIFFKQQRERIQRLSRSHVIGGK